MKKISFTAFDVETANRKLHSICSIGLVRVENGEIVKRVNYLIKPPENYYESKNIEIHGITPDKTELSPSFAEIWNLIHPYFKEQLVVAHNISFDRSALRQTLEYYNIEVPQFDEDCSYKLSGMRLNHACMNFGIELIHHNSLSDAEACARLYLKLIDGESQQRRLNSVPDQKKSEKTQFHEKIHKEFCCPDLKNANPNHPFYGQKAVLSGIFNNFSRNDLAKLLCSFGCQVLTTITTKTSFLVIGNEFGPVKYQKAKKEGIQIINENELIRILSWQEQNTNQSTSHNCGINQAFKGKTFVVSGVFQHFSRDGIKQAIEEHGGKNVASVSGSTDFLVAGENMGPAKREKAAKLGVKIISEEEFLSMIT